MPMRPFFILLLLFASCSLSGPGIFAQKTYLEHIPQSAIDSANTAARCRYMTEEERRVFLYVNLARIRPKLFWNEIALPYFTDQGEQSDNMKSLKTDLYKLRPVQPLLPDSGLYAAAKTHAVKTGDKGLVGHQDLDTRFRKNAPYCMGHYGENCSYGSENSLGLAAVMQLLLDDGVADLIHRKNILEPDFNRMGAAMHTHTRYDYVCVMDFGRK